MPYDPNKMYPVEEYIKILDREEEILRQRKILHIQALEINKVTEVPGKFLREEEYSRLGEGHINQRRPMKDFIQMQIAYICQTTQTLVEIARGIRQPYK